MPGNNPAGNRYLTTIVTTQVMMELIAIFGLLMFILSDSDNTLTIFSGMALLGMFLHRPKIEEYLDIEESLKKLK